LLDSRAYSRGWLRAQIFDRDGSEVGVFPRGDMYIRDQKNTKGHVMGCTGGQWHPTEHAEAMTCSFDGTIRLWNTFEFTAQKAVLKPAQIQPGRVPVTACCYSPDGRLIAGGLGDGSLQVCVCPTSSPHRVLKYRGTL
jgi:WD40 repeat protein